MAEWNHKPFWTYPLRVNGPKTLVTRFDDYKSNRRVKATLTAFRVREIHFVDAATLDAMLITYSTKSRHTSLSKVSYFPGDTPGQERNFFFANDEVDAEWVSVDEWRVTFDFELDMN